MTIYGRIYENNLFGNLYRIIKLYHIVLIILYFYLNRFGVTEDIIRPFLEGKTMKEAMDGKMLFIIDLGILEHCPTDSECKVSRTS